MPSPAIARSQDRSSIEWWVGPSSPYAMPGLIPHSTTGDWLYATSALICSSARPVRNGDAPQTNGTYPLSASPAPTPTMSCSAMPTLISRSGNSVGERAQVAGAHRVVADRDDPLVLAGERDELLGEGDPAVEDLLHRRAHRASSAVAVLICSAVGTLWCHSTRSSMKETPLPLVVLAMTQVGRSPRRRGEHVQQRQVVVSVDHDDVPAEGPELVVERVERVGVLGAARPAGGGCGRRRR